MMPLQTKTGKKIAEPHIFQITVRSDAPEIGMVVAYPIPKKEGEAAIQGKIKTFRGEKEKLLYVRKAQQKGFQNFSTVSGKIDVERMILQELARRQAMERKMKKNKKHL